MATITIPDELKAQAQARAVEAGFSSVDDYVAAFLRGDPDVECPAPEHLKVRTHEQAVALAREGLKSPGQVMTPADFERRRAELVAKHAPKAAG